MRLGTIFALSLYKFMNLTHFLTMQEDFDLIAAIIEGIQEKKGRNITLTSPVLKRLPLKVLS